MLRIVIDANGLISRILSNYFLHLGTHDEIQLIWSDSLLHEVEKNLAKKSGKPEKAHQFVEVMKFYHPGAHVKVLDADVKSLRAQQSGVDDGDTHILATAIAGKAAIIATDNTKDFIGAKEWMMKNHGIKLMDHGELLEKLFNEYPELSIDVHRYLLTGQYAEKGQDHMFSVLRRATKQAERSIQALETVLVELDDYEDSVPAIERAMSVAFHDAVDHIASNRAAAESRLGTKSITWVGPYTKTDGRFVSGHWRKL